MRILKLLISIFLLHVSSVSYANETPNSYAVVTAHRLATQAGEEILNAGGNAFDAAVAVSAALAVVQPYGSGIGGGGFWLIHDARTGEDIVIDGREVAPLAATKDMYLDADGNLTGKSINGPLAAGIPGVVAALEYITEYYGSLPFSQNLEPAIRYAREGFVPGDHYLKLASLRKQALLESRDAKQIFLHDDEIPEKNSLIIQNDLAETLTAISMKGAVEFYSGDVAKKLVEGVREAGGIWTIDDLQQYQIEIREPISTQYHDLKIIMPPPPTSGGVVITQILAMLEDIELDGIDSVNAIHTIVEAMRRAYQDRAIYLGDPDFSEIPLHLLLDHKYAKDKFSTFDENTASKSKDLKSPSSKGEDTTHFSILDKNGNYVAATLSINYPFGSGFVAPGTGVLLNDEMDDFSMGEDVANIWGLVGSEANAIEPGKRMLSSMTPLFAHDDTRTLIVGTPGGSRIISMLTLALLKFQMGASSDEIVSQRRFHHQYIPDEIQYELDVLNADEIEQLSSKGHSLKELNRKYGDMHAIIWDTKTGSVESAADPRGEGIVNSN